MEYEIVVSCKYLIGCMLKINASAIDLVIDDGMVGEN